MDEAARWVARDDLDLVEVDDGFALFDGTTGRTVFLNHTASQVLSLADGRTDFATMANLLAEAYGVAPEEIARDVRSALDALAEAGAFQEHG